MEIAKWRNGFDNPGMDRYRFYVPGLAERAGAGGGTIILPEDELHHARTVLRLEPGEIVVLFDGHGAWAEGILAGGESTGKSRRGEMRVELSGEIHEDPLPARNLTIATAVPKGERAEWLIEQTSQLNAACVQWIDCDRSVVKPREGGQKIDKWRRLAVESAKQCGRTHLMRVEEPASLAAIVDASLRRGATVLWLEPRRVRRVRASWKRWRIAKRPRSWPSSVRKADGASGSGRCWRRRRRRARSSAYDSRQQCCGSKPRALRLGRS